MRGAGWEVTTSSMLHRLVSVNDNSSSGVSVAAAARPYAINQTANRAEYD